MNGIGGRIRKARKARGMTLEALAVACGWEGAGRISNYEAGRRPPKVEDLRKLSAALSVPFVWLTTGEGEIDAAADKGAHHIGATVPVIDFPTLAAVNFGKDFDPATMAVDRSPCPVKHGSRTFALRVQDAAQVSSSEPKSYPVGCLTYVDPDQVDAGNDVAVLARLENGHIVFAQHMEQAGRRWLRFKNKDYSPITEPFEVVGLVIGKWEDP
ncbi:MAG: helix-turn-helix domain-containing protein [Gammaproteobacteria bacterium]